MKKKIKDLTIAECRVICKRYKFCVSAQRTCPLYHLCWRGAIGNETNIFFDGVVEA